MKVTITEDTEEEDVLTINFKVSLDQAEEIKEEVVSDGTINWTIENPEYLARKVEKALYEFEVGNAEDEADLLNKDEDYETELWEGEI